MISTVERQVLGEIDDHRQIQIDNESLRWMAPELLAEGAKRTTQSDVYAFAMTILEVCSILIQFYTRSNSSLSLYQICTGEPPYSNFIDDNRIRKAIIEGEVPDISNMHSTPAFAFFSKDLWPLCLRCWQNDAGLRPTMNRVVEAVRHLFLAL